MTYSGISPKFIETWYILRIFLFARSLDVFGVTFDTLSSGPVSNRNILSLGAISSEHVNFVSQYVQYSSNILNSWVEATCTLILKHELLKRCSPDFSYLLSAILISIQSTDRSR